MKGLYALWIEGNNFSKIPEQVFEMPQLKSLGLDLYNDYENLDSLSILNDYPNMKEPYNGLYFYGDVGIDRIQKMLPNIKVYEM